MMIARWHIDARFGYKQKVIEALQAWNNDIGKQIGWTPDKLRITTGSVGAAESTVEVEVRIRDLAELSEAWDKLGAIAAHKQWSMDLEPNVVSGSTRWEVLRVV